MTVRLAFLLSLMLAVLAVAYAAPASAGTPVTLNTDLTDTTGHVTLGELFDNAGPARDVVVADRAGPTVVMDAGAVQAFARRYGLDWDNPRGISRIIAHGEMPGQVRNHEVLTYGRNLNAGEIVQASDLVWAKAAGIPVDAPSNVDAVIGMAARRPLRQGDSVLAHDVTPPIVIKTGETVSVIYADQGITLTLEGKALSNAAVGDTVNVMNTASKKAIEAVATGVDQAVVGPEAQRLKAERNPAQIALR